MELGSEAGRHQVGLELQIGRTTIRVFTERPLGSESEAALGFCVGLEFHL